MIVVRFKGNIRETKFEADQLTSNQCQLWHLKTFADIVNNSVEFIFDYEDVEIAEEVIEPFYRLSDKLYGLKTDIVIETPDKFDIMIMPHYMFYTKPNVPLPVPTNIRTDWYNKSIEIVFVKPSDKHVFQKGKPFAQGIFVKRQDIKLTQITEKDLERIRERNKFVDSQDKYVTRKWMIGNIEQNNLYDMLAKKEDRNCLPVELQPRKKKIYSSTKKDSHVPKR